MRMVTELYWNELLAGSQISTEFNRIVSVTAPEVAESRGTWRWPLQIGFVEKVPEEFVA
jgi:hypothetical protein